MGSLSAFEIVATTTLAGKTIGTVAGVMCTVFVVVPLVTFMAKVGRVQQTRERVTPVVMVSYFDEKDLFIFVGSGESYHVRLVDGEYFDLILGQDVLKLLQLSDTTRTFYHASLKVQRLGCSCLRGASLSHSEVIGIAGIVCVGQDLHRHDGTGTTELIVVDYPNYGPF